MNIALAAAFFGWEFGSWFSLCSLDFQRVWWLTVSCFTDLFGGCVQGKMLTGG